MNQFGRLPLKLFSFLLLMLAAVFWLLLVSGVHVGVRYHYRRNNHAGVRRWVGRGCRLGIGAFRLWGLRVSSNHESIEFPAERPIVLVSSHHSSLDMCFLLGLLENAFGDRNLRFVSRPGLDRGLPTISFYIKQYCYSLGSAGAFKARRKKEDRLHMAQYCQQMNRDNGVVTIFPEGVKARELPEHSGSFNPNGLRLMLENMPDAVVVPLAIKGSGDFYCTPRQWKHLLQGVPQFGVSVKLSMLPPLEPRNYASKAALIAHCETLISNEYERLSHGKEIPVDADRYMSVGDEAAETDFEEAC